MDIKCKLIAYEKCSKTTIIFFNDYYTDEKFKIKYDEFRLSKKVKKIIKLENSVEEILYERD